MPSDYMDLRRALSGAAADGIGAGTVITRGPPKVRLQQILDRVVGTVLPRLLVLEAAGTPTFAMAVENGRIRCAGPDAGDRLPDVVTHDSLETIAASLRRLAETDNPILVASRRYDDLPPPEATGVSAMQLSAVFGCDGPEDRDADPVACLASVAGPIETHSRATDGDTRLDEGELLIRGDDLVSGSARFQAMSGGQVLNGAVDPGKVPDLVAAWKRCEAGLTAS